MFLKIFACVAFAISLATSHCKGQDTDFFEQPPINYSRTKPNDAVTHLQDKLAAGQVKFEGSDREVVLALLRELNIPVASQTLVFSKTSFQAPRISPNHPRALYYNDNCYLGWVPGGLVEVVAVDPKLGPVFYSFDPRLLAQNGRPDFSRESSCLTCHGGHFIPDIPAVFTRSVYATDTGAVLYHQGTTLVDYQTPFDQRWGGWYVTGTHGKTLHRGNVFAEEKNDKLIFDPTPGANVTNLTSFVSTDEYLAASSDIVTLLVLEHQTAMQNALTRAEMKYRQMLSLQKQAEKQSKKPAGHDAYYQDMLKRTTDECVGDVVDVLLFKGEVDLPDRITGSEAFQKAFAADARRAKDGASLKDLELSDHLFKNRCSYMIYSPSFRELPSPLKIQIFHRLNAALSLTKIDPRYSYIHDSERRRIMDILLETDQEFSDEVKKVSR